LKEEGKKRENRRRNVSIDVRFLRKRKIRKGKAGGKWHEKEWKGSGMKKNGNKGT